MLSATIKKYIDQSVLCWLATSSATNIPNVSPKEIFHFHGNSNIIIANIASPQSIKNILENQNVCVSFIDIFVQKGFQLKGVAEIIDQKEGRFEQMAQPLIEMAGEKFPFGSIINIKVESVKPILAPIYLLYPESTTEASQIESAMRNYKLKK